MKFFHSIDPPENSSEITDRWALRALGLATLAIAVGTLFPFEFFIRETAARRAYPFLLWLRPGLPSLQDFGENVLLFIPFGFGFNCWARHKKWKKPVALLAALIAGAIFSYTIEFLQIFLLPRDSSWSDVISNTVGSVAGYAVFDRWGGAILRLASSIEAGVERFFTFRRIVVAFVGYTALMLVVSGLLERSARLSTWGQTGTFYLATSPAGRYPWNGRILSIDQANQSILSEEQATNFSGKEAGCATPLGKPVFNVHLTRENPCSTGRLENPNPSKEDVQAERVQLKAPELPRVIPAAAFLAHLRQTNRFNLNVVCIPPDKASDTFSVILALARDPQHTDFFLAQQGDRLVFGLRTPLFGEAEHWGLTFPGALSPGRRATIVIEYDGADLSANVNGKDDPHPIRLGPGAVLVHRFKGVGIENIRGYAVTYDGLFFAPLGFLLALAARNPVRRWAGRTIFLAFGIALPPLLLEGVLVGVSGRPFDVGNIALGFAFVIGTWLLLNADLRSSPHRVDANI